MKRLILHWMLAAVALLLTVWLVGEYGLHLTGSFLQAFVATAALGLLNALVRPFLILLRLITLPLTCLTFGLFGLLLSFACNAAVFYFVGREKWGFEVTGWLPAVLGAAVMSVINAVLSLLSGERKRAAWV